MKQERKCAKQNKRKREAKGRWQWNMRVIYVEYESV